MKTLKFLILILLYGSSIHVIAFPEQGSWYFEYIYLSETGATEDIPKSLFNGSHIYINVHCTEPPISKGEEDSEVHFIWSLYRISCWNNIQVEDDELPNTPGTVISHGEGRGSCHGVIPMDDSMTVERVADESKSAKDNKQRKKRSDESPQEKSENIPQNHPIQSKKDPNIQVNEDGMYVLRFQIRVENSRKPNITVKIDMKGPYGYLSAIDWPLLPFYGAMCLVYVIFGLAWLIVSFCQWRDLLRIQFWIGGVILLGMLEKAAFYAEYQSINLNGVSMKGAVLFAELVSCGKRMLARMLVIIVSLGFGIVKPRLGPMLHRVVGTGILYFILAAVESYLRVMQDKNDRSKQILIASIPLAVLDSAICWWIFTSLIQTTRTLRLRRNLVKLSLYRHFTNTLIFSVVSSVIFMLYSIRYHRLADCLKDWKELWIDDAYWHLLFSVLLLVIMILWRPTNNNQRYAFTPLLDAPEDDDEEDEQFVNDAFGVKMRGMRSNSPKPKSTNSVEEDLKWIEENIPSSVADTALPILDSDEEIMTTKFEVSKMQ